MSLQYIVPGRPVSNNRVTRRFGNRSVKSTEARTYQQLVFQHAFAAAQRVGWVMPEACEVIIHAYNVQLDIGNIEKCVSDGMQGAVYADDRIIVKQTIEKFKDHDGQRLIVTVHAREALAKPPKPRKKAA